MQRGGVGGRGRGDMSIFAGKKEGWPYLKMSMNK